MRINFLFARPPLLKMHHFVTKFEKCPRYGSNLLADEGFFLKPSFIFSAINCFSFVNDYHDQETAKGSFRLQL